ncbi:DUF432 domain-containing protein [Marinimicrobium alkaliphilum]|uniref:DUF432 domain-containing protein n=1 Tax=Marinimicrobium alkaliphilum TaxID=2202654 RepID=UPI000DB980EF|nr:DUF432 domain-containing protein [Marinimicrobium alkaliphilum]
MTPDANPPLKPWWQPRLLDRGECWHTAIGPLSIYLYRFSSQWLLATQTLGDEADHSQLISEEVQEIPEELNLSRYVFTESPKGFVLRPRTLDRPLVVKTMQPVHVPPGEKVTFYISSPVTVEIDLVEPDTILQETPVLRLSDTWFGPSTRVGELCYAARTHARNSRADVPPRPHRVVTPVTIHNEGEQNLTIEKLSIPVPYLAIYGLDDGTLWSDPVTLAHSDGNALAGLKIDSRLPDGVSPEHRIAEPRVEMPRGSFVRAFTSIFSD